MNAMIITDINELVADWNNAQFAVTGRDQEIFAAIVLNGETRAQITKRYGISNERVRQIADRAAGKFRQTLLSQKQSPVVDAINRMAHLVDAAGIQSAFSLAQVQFHQSETVATQLVNTNAVLPQHTDWALAIAHLIRRPSPPRPSLRYLASQARNLIGQHHLGATPEHVFHHLQPWHTTFAAWPNFDLALHIQAVTGVTPDPKHGRYHPVEDWPITRRTHVYQSRHHVALALYEANKPLTISEITARANTIAKHEGKNATYRPRTVAAIVGSDDQYRWVGQSTYGLAEWDIGHSGQSRLPTKRTSVATEIVHLLRQSPTPVPVREIKQHIAQRFQITQNAVNVALARGNGHEFIIDDNQMVRLGEPEP